MAEYNQAYQESLDYFSGDELAANVFVTKYSLTDRDGDFIETTPDEMHRRIASEFSRVEEKVVTPAGIAFSHKSWSYCRA